MILHHLRWLLAQCQSGFLRKAGFVVGKGSLKLSLSVRDIRINLSIIKGLYIKN